MKPIRLLPSALLFLVSSPLLAQSMTINPNGVISPGDTVSINYSNPAYAGISVMVTVTNSDGFMQYVEIHLDSNGDGSGEWTAPQDWTKAYFNAADVPEEIVVIV